MSNPASPVLANIIMNYFINSVLRRSALFQIPRVKIYVDDLSVAVSRDNANKILNINFNFKFNSVNNKIHYTMEVDVDHKIPFFDATLVSKIEQLSQIVELFM